MYMCIAVIIASLIQVSIAYYYTGCVYNEIHSPKTICLHELCGHMMGTLNYESIQEAALNVNCAGSDMAPWVRVAALVVLWALVAYCMALPGSTVSVCMCL